ncbi:MAG: adenosyl-hopene transferase HpnH, partial [Acetobacteraceae bacterium]
EKCADCMVHSGYEATAVSETVRRPWRAAMQAVRGIRTDGPMAPEISLEGQRPAEYVFSRHVEQAMARIRSEKRQAAGD